MPVQFTVRPIEAEDRTAVAQLLEGPDATPVVSPSGVHDPAALPGFVATEDGTVLGALTLRVAGGEIEVVTLSATPPGRDVGTALLAAVRQLAAAQEARLWLITTDDNVGAQRFFERCGMRPVRCYPRFVDTVATVKPQARLTFCDAIEYSD
jgi:ribosomal protein S18 acetylase RimI-like enzyme